MFDFVLGAPFICFLASEGVKTIILDRALQLSSNIW